jgi:uncharacterized damage-inducible protein DinB
MSDDPLSTRVGERETLIGTLVWYRAVVLGKLRDLSDADASRALAPNGLSLLGIIWHLAWAEELWFRFRFAGEDLPDMESGGDNSPTFVLPPGSTVASVTERYTAAAEHSDRIAGTAASLDEVAVRSSWRWGGVSLRWLLVHMIEETARHAGHLDIMRELLDGTTGD